MNILAIDTSGMIAGTAVLRDGNIVYEAIANNRLTHSENIMPMIDEALKRSETDKRHLHAIAVVTGPGSFTGVRLGVAAAKGLATALRIRVFPVDALEAMAQSAAGFDGLVVAMQDARAGQVYRAGFHGNTMERVLNDAPEKISDVCEEALKASFKTLFIGDGAVRYRNEIMQHMGDRACFAPEHLHFIHPSAVALLGMRHPETLIAPSELLPLYLRAPQAERRRNLVSQYENR